MIAKRKEIDELQSREVCRTIKLADLPAGCNILGWRFIISIKSPGTEEEKYKARFVVQGHQDSKKPFMLHDIPVLWAESIQTVLSVASVLDLRQFSGDVVQKYCQSKEKLSRSIAIKPKEKDRETVSIQADEVLNLENVSTDSIMPENSGKEQSLTIKKAIWEWWKRLPILPIHVVRK